MGKMNVQAESSIEDLYTLQVGNGLNFIELQSFSSFLNFTKNIYGLPIEGIRKYATKPPPRFCFTFMRHVTRLVSLGARFIRVEMTLKRKASDAGTVSRARRRIETMTDYCDASPRTDASGSILWPASGEAMEDARNFIRAW